MGWKAKTWKPKQKDIKYAEDDFLKEIEWNLKDKCVVLNCNKKQNHAFRFKVGIPGLTVVHTRVGVRFHLTEEDRRNLSAKRECALTCVIAAMLCPG